MLPLDDLPTRRPENTDARRPIQRSGLYAYGKDERIAGRFRVLERAVGGYGHVYLCYDQGQDYFYALKTLILSQEALEDPSTVARIKREVDTWIGLGQHPHIVRCFGFERLDNLPFAILEWVADDDRLCELYREQYGETPHFFDWYARLGQPGLALRSCQALRNRQSAGTSLAAWIRSRQGLPLDFALQIALDICAGMQYAQEVQPGLVHRDLKPANVLLNEQLEAKVSDFGTAILIEDLLEPGKPAGTPEYRAPEQWRSESLDARTDIYAMGCTLYAMLTGVPPFLSPTPNLEHLRHSHLVLPPPRLPGSLSPRVDDIVQTCLHKEPSGRFSSFAELAQALSEVYKGITSTPPRVAATSPVESVETLNRRAVTYLNLGHFEMAIAQFERAIKLDGSYPNTYTNRGCLHHVQGQYEEALADYQQAIRLGRSAINSRVFNNRGLVHLAFGRLGKAEKDIERAIGLDEEYANAYVNLGIVRIAQERYDEALAAFERGLEVNPKHVIAHNNCGFVHHYGGQLDAAIAQYTAALDQDPFFLRAWINRYLAYGEVGNESAAAHDWKQIVALGKGEIDPEGVEATPIENPPDSQFDNRGSFRGILGQPLRQKRLREQYELEAMGLAPKPPQRIPLDLIVTVRDVAYSAQLHDSIVDLQSAGHRVTQLTLQVDVSQADGEYRPYSALQEWDIILDDETTRQFSGHDMRTLADLTGRRLRLRNEYPNDAKRPLRISIAY